jgi:hypothetical protein
VRPRWILITAVLAFAMAVPAARAQEAPPTTAAPAPPTTAAAPVTTAVPPEAGAVTLAVTPDEGLVDGQTVAVSGTGYPPNRTDWAIWACPPGAVAAGASIDLGGSCGGIDQVSASTDAGGVLAGTFTARQVIERFDRGATEFDCGVSGCEVFMVSQNHLYLDDPQVITFGGVIAASPAFTG